MKEFNLELAKAGYPVQTRDGRPVKIICYNRKDKDYSIVALVEDANYDTERIEQYTISGKYDIYVAKSDSDLFMAPTKQEGWMNLYREPRKIWGGHVFNTEEEALENASPGVIATIKIEWEE